MSDTKWTPGPWIQNGCFVSDSENLHSIVSGVTNRPDEELYANAALIAAAPDLYGELAETHAALCFTEGYIGSLRYKRNKAALAKARGEHND